MSILLLTSINLRDFTFKELTKGDVVRLSTMGKTLPPAGVSPYKILERTFTIFKMFSRKIYILNNLFPEGIMYSDTS